MSRAGDLAGVKQKASARAVKRLGREAKIGGVRARQIQSKKLSQNTPLKRFFLKAKSKVLKDT
ncbi:hypothetical protein CUPS4256_08730 [Campylobacter upsaliensis]|uniref:hypothetical protein n=1 Tax=Campylobacter upsaliensis TaxID=28080 RepID=UPI00214A4217|nr:hypothetical protein [Campylobacter upsaliensis]MCR2103325.1 hypothetical protein [Campylobacter upsaliensis]